MKAWSELSQEIIERLNKMESSTKAFVDGLEQSKKCHYHGIDQKLDREKSAHEHRGIYEPCADCVYEEYAIGESVPENMLHATLDNYECTSTAEIENLETVRKFCEVGRGFLILSGGYGTGKTHLALGAARRQPQWRTGFHFITQSQLLLKLRATYQKDSKAKSPLPRAQHSGLFILDEVGVSGGGRDELPLLHDIFCHRYNNKLPTIITSNLTLSELKDTVGERVYDRFTECAYAVLKFGGASHRREAKQRYFET